MIKSPLRYPGGKSRAVQLISTLIPKFDEFREPFVGGGSVFINQKQLNPNSKFWINDLYEPLYYFWKESKNNNDLVIENVRKFQSQYPVGKELFLYLKSNYKEFNDIEKAATFFIFNRITFSGTSDSGGYSEMSFKGRFTESSIERVKEIEPILKETRITNIDYKDIVETEGENVFIFLDPPYYNATKSALYGKNGDLHKGFDHIRFCEVMKNCNHNWLITLDDSEYIRDLWSFSNIFEWNLTYGMRNVVSGSDQVGKELFISNYLTELPEIRTIDNKKSKLNLQTELIL